MDVAELNELESPNILSNKSETTTRLRRRYFNWAIISYLIASFMAVILSIGAAAVGLFLIVDSYLNGIDHPVWADITISLL